MSNPYRPRAEKSPQTVAKTGFMRGGRQALAKRIFGKIRQIWAGKNAIENDFFGAGEDMIALHGRDGRFLKVSLAAEKLLGVPAEQLIGRTLGEIVVPEQRGQILDFLTRGLGLKQTGREIFCIMRPDCRLRWVEMTATPMGDGLLRTITRDVTHQRLAHEALDEARSEAEALALARSRHLADLSHEIRTPLNAVIGFAEIMERETFGPIGNEKYAEYAELIHRSGDHLLSLVSDLLDLSKIEADRYQLDIQEADIASIARDCVDMMGLGAEQAGLALEMTGDVDLCLAEVDPRAVRQILLNLLSNAIKFTRAGSVTLDISMQEKTVRLAVSDTGIGMSKEAVASIGGRYVQAHRESVRGVRGTGLGLALVRSLCELHGGNMDVVSKPDEGTTIFVTLPLRAIGQKGADKPLAKEADRPSLEERASLPKSATSRPETAEAKDEAFESFLRAFADRGEPKKSQEKTRKVA